MATFYPIDFSRAIPNVKWSSGMNESSAVKYVSNGSGYDVWTRYESDARSLANHFPNPKRDVAHFRMKRDPGSAPTFNYSFEHYHFDNNRGRVHIMFGNAYEDAGRHHMLDIESLR